MKLLDDLLAALPDGEVLDVCLGLHWTAVLVRSTGQVRCGLASTSVALHNHSAEPDVAQAGQLHTLSALELAHLARSEQPIQASIGVATINALLPPKPALWRDLNAEEVIATHGAGKVVALIGSFPFVPRLRSRVGRLFVLELQPKDNELPAEAAPDILPQADIVAITSMTLVNHSLENLLSLCTPAATVLLLGPSTPLSPILFEQGIDLLSGSVVTNIDPVLTAIKQGANFRQVHQAGVRLVTMSRNG
jgi:uncharacterized protein (DUF4213/DUF364 family)